MRFRDYIDVDNVCRASHNLKTLKEGEEEEEKEEEEE